MVLRIGDRQPPTPVPRERQLLVHLPVTLLDRTVAYLERRGLTPWSDEIDGVITDALTEHLDRKERRRGR